MESKDWISRVLWLGFESRFSSGKLGDADAGVVCSFLWSPTHPKTIIFSNKEEFFLLTRGNEMVIDWDILGDNYRNLP